MTPFATQISELFEFPAFYGSKSHSPNGWGKGRDAPRGSFDPVTSLKIHVWFSQKSPLPWCCCWFAPCDIWLNGRGMFETWNLDTFSKGWLNLCRICFNWNSPTSKWDHPFWTTQRLFKDDFRPKITSDHRNLLGNCLAKLPNMTKKTARNHSTNPPPAAASWQGRFFFPASLFDIASPNKNTYLSFWAFPSFLKVDVFRNFYCQSLKKKGMFIGNFQKVSDISEFFRASSTPVRSESTRWRGKHRWNLNPCVSTERHTTKHKHEFEHTNTHTHVTWKNV